MKRVVVAIVGVAALSCVAALAFAGGVIPGTNGCVLNGPPYGAYVTWHIYFQDRGQRALGFDRRMLGSEWVSQLGGPHEETFRRGRASLYVQFSEEATSFAVDYRGYARTPR